MRYFTPWHVGPGPTYGELQDYYLPPVAAEATGQRKVPIGVFMIAALDTARRDRAEIESGDRASLRAS